MRNRTLHLLLLTVLLGGISSPLAGGEASTEASEAAKAPGVGSATAEELLPRGRAPLPGLVTGGEPSQAQLEAIAAEGFRTVINLRTEEEPTEIAAEDVRNLGMRYVHIPVEGADGMTLENVDLLDRVLDDEEAYPVVLYCGSGNRVGGLLALRAAWMEHRTPEEALELGIDAGLTRLQPVVKETLGLSENDAEGEDPGGDEPGE